MCKDVQGSPDEPPYIDYCDEVEVLAQEMLDKSDTLTQREAYKAASREVHYRAAEGSSEDE